MQGNNINMEDIEILEDLDNGKKEKEKKKRGRPLKPRLENEEPKIKKKKGRPRKHHEKYTDR